MDSTILKSETRKEAAGKGPSRRLRAAGRLPGNIYRAGKDSKPVTLDMHQVHVWLSHHTGESLIVDVEIDGGAPTSMLLKEAQHHPVTDNLLHVDFYEIDPNSPIKVTIPLNIHGTPIGVSQGGGTTDYLIRSLHIKCLPGDVVEEFEVDISHLEIGDIIFVKELAIDREKFEVLTEDDIGVVSIAKPRLAAVDETEEGASAEGEGEEGEAADGATEGGEG